MGQKWIGLLSAMFILMHVSACKQHVAEDLQPTAPALAESEKTDNTPRIGSSEEVVMASDDLSLTLKDYEQCIDVHRLMGRPYSKRALANPRFQRDESQRCFQQKFIREHLKKMGVQSTSAERDRVIRGAMERENVQSEQALAEKLGVKFEALAEYADAALLPTVLQRALVSQMADAEVRKLFDVDFRRYTLEWIDFENRVTPAEVDQFLIEKKEVFSHYLGAHQDLLKGLPKAKFVRMGYTQSGGEADYTAQKAAAALRLTAIQQGVDAAIAACQADKQRGCAVLNDTQNLYIEARNEKNVWAFRSAVGTVSELIHTPVMDEIWILQGIEPPQQLDIHHPETRQELGRKVMTALVPSPHLLEQIRPEIEVQQPDLKVIAEKYNGQYHQLDAIYYLDLVEKNQIESPKMMQILAEMRPEESRLFSNPIVDKGRVYIFYVHRLEMPTDADFEAHKGEWKSRREADATLEIANRWVQEKMPRMTSLNIKPLQNTYGILQPNGVIR